MEAAILTSADVAAYRAMMKGLKAAPRLSRLIAREMKDALVHMVEDVPPIDWSRLTLGLDGIAVDHRPSEGGLPTHHQLANLLSGAALDVFRDPDNVEYFVFALLRIRLRLDEAAHDTFRRRVLALLCRRGIELPPAVGALLTIALRDDASTHSSLGRRRARSALRVPIVNGVAHPAPGVFELRIFRPAECAEILRAMNRSRAWEPAEVIDYADLLGERRMPDKIRRKADTLEGHVGEKFVAEFRTRAERRIVPALRRLWGLDISEIREAHTARYGPGDFFSAHTDHGIKTRDRQFSIVCYVNDDFVGGLTAFPPLRTYVRPRAGMALVFPSEYLHASTPIASGRKHIFVGFASKAAVHESVQPPVAAVAPRRVAHTRSP